MKKTLEFEREQGMVYGEYWSEEREGGMTQLYENLKNKRDYKIHGVFWKGYCQYSVNTCAQILQESNWSGHGFAVTSVMGLRTVDVVTENEDCTVCAKGQLVPPPLRYQHEKSAVKMSSCVTKTLKHLKWDL